MVSVTSMGQPVQHLWKTMCLLYILLTRVLLILERRVDSCLVWFSLYTKTTLTASMCLFAVKILAKDLVSSCHYLEVGISSQQILGIYLTPFALYAFIRYSYLSVVDCLQSAFPHLQVTHIQLSQLAVCAHHYDFSDEKYLENINSIVYLYLQLTDLIPSLWCEELRCLQTALVWLLTKSQKTLEKLVSLETLTKMSEVWLILPIAKIILSKAEQDLCLHFIVPFLHDKSNFWWRR